MNPPDNQFPEERDNAGLPGMLLVMLIVFLLIPFAGMYLFADTLNPFDLTGKPFLLFYTVLSIIAYGIAYALQITGHAQLKNASWPVGNETIPAVWKVARWIVTATILLGVARLVRGIYLGRPVIFLCLMLLAHAILYSAFFKVASRTVE